MKLINRYVSEVGKHLPLIQGREDIEKELRSTLEDMLEERATKAGRHADEAMEIELLKEYGSPQKVAMTYNPHPYLIGPRVFPFFLMILKIVFFGIAIGLSVVTIIQLLSQLSTGAMFMGADFMKTILQGAGNIISTSIGAFGYVVVAFVLIERFVPDFKIDFEEEKEWDPAALAKEPDADSVSRGELIAEIVFTFVGLAILNFYPQILGMYFFSGEQSFFIPLFSDVFQKFVPWINLIFLAEIAVDIYLLRNAVWTTATRVAKIIIEGASLVLAIVFVRTTDIIGFTAESFANSPFTPEQAERFVTVANVSITIGIIVVVVIVSVELIKAVIGLVKSLNKK
ncbi:MAG: hypothetical protein KF758_09865 [Anaerolineales bacterium]|nr:hypothetical protein [Anaerolineales bacterium]